MFTLCLMLAAAMPPPPRQRRHVLRMMLICHALRHAMLHDDLFMLRRYDMLPQRCRYAGCLIDTLMMMQRRRRVIATHADYFYAATPMLIIIISRCYAAGAARCLSARYASHVSPTICRQMPRCQLIATRHAFDAMICRRFSLRHAAEATRLLYAITR